MKTILIIMVALAAIGMASAWPMENGTVQLSKISFDEIKGMDTGMSGDLASVGATKEQSKVLDIGDAGKIPSNYVPAKAAYMGAIQFVTDPRSMI
jgi:hypothetical protein